MFFLKTACEYCREYATWGLNATTFIFLATVAFSVFQAWGLYSQGRTIWKHERAEAVSVTLFVYLSSFLTATLIYGFAVHSAAMIINGLLCFFYLPILIGLWKFKGFGFAHIALSALLLVTLLVMIVYPLKQEIYFVSSSGVVLFGSTQPYEMWRKKSARDVGGGFIFASLLSTAFWCAYAFAINDPVLRILSPITLILLCVSFSLWLKYPKN